MPKRRDDKEEDTGQYYVHNVVGFLTDWSNWEPNFDEGGSQWPTGASRILPNLNHIVVDLSRAHRSATVKILDGLVIVLVTSCKGTEKTKSLDMAYAIERIASTAVDIIRRNGNIQELKLIK